MRRRGDVAFYGLLASACIAAAALALWTQERHHARQPSTRRQTTVAAATVAPANRDSVEDHARRLPHRVDRTLSIQASRGRSWIVIRARSSRGPVLYQGILEKGGVVEEHGTAFWAEVGAVANVDVRLDRKAVRLGRSALGGVLLAAGGVRPPAASSPSGIVGS